MLNYIHSFPEGTRIAILTEIVLPEGRTFDEQLDVLIKGGYSRLEKDGRFFQIADVKANDPADADTYRLLIDRVAVTNNKEDDMRILDSLQTAFYEGREECVIKCGMLMEALPSKYSQSVSKPTASNFKSPLT